MNAQTLPPSPPLLILKPKSDENLMEWIAVILGEAGTPYEGGQFWLNITIPDSYPIQPPIIQFTTRICHPNVHFKVGPDFAHKHMSDLMKDLTSSSLQRLGRFAWMC